MMTRREWIASATAAAGVAAFDRRLAWLEIKNFGEAQKQIIAIEKASGGRLGVSLLDTGSGVEFGYHANDRFPMCSTFKVLAVSAVLKRIDRSRENLDRIVHYTPADLLEYAPTTKLHVDSGMSVAALCEAAITLSDNTAANLLLNIIGGPSGVTAFARELGDSLTRLDRNEPALNEALPGDPRDTSAPASIAHDLRKITFGDVLAPASRDRLVAWLVANQTGGQRLRAGFPSQWKVADKTGTGQRGTANDLAIVWPPQRAPVLVAVYLTGATTDRDHQEAAIAETGKVLAAQITN